MDPDSLSGPQSTFAHSCHALHVFARSAQGKQVGSVGDLSDLIGPFLEGADDVDLDKAMESLHEQFKKMDLLGGDQGSVWSHISHREGKGKRARVLTPRGRLLPVLGTSRPIVGCCEGHPTDLHFWLSWTISALVTDATANRPLLKRTSSHPRSQTHAHSQAGAAAASKSPSAGKRTSGPAKLPTPMQIEIPPVPQLNEPTTDNSERDDDDSSAPDSPNSPRKKCVHTYYAIDSRDTLLASSEIRPLPSRGSVDP